MSPSGQGPLPGADSLRAVLDSVFAGAPYRWVEHPNPLAFFSRWMNALQQWLVDLQDTHPTLYRFFLGALALLVVLIVVHAGWVFFRTIRSGRAPEGVALPVFAERRDRAWYRRQANLLAAEGQYAEALQHEFLGLVLALDARALLRFHPSKTPAEYGREARLAPQSQEEFRALIGALYGFAFGRRPCGREDFVSWRAHAEPERYAPAL